MTSDAETPESDLFGFDRSSVRSDTKTGVGWNLSLRIISKGLQFVFSIVLARLLPPEAFGLVGMVLIFLTFMEIFLDFGLSTALVQGQDLSGKHFSTVFWVHLGAGVFLWLIFTLSSPLIAGFYGYPILARLTPFMALSFPLSGLSLVPQALLRKNMMFKRYALVDIAGPIVSGGGAVLLAWSGYGVWSLASEVVIYSLVTLVLSVLFIGWIPDFGFDGNALRDLTGFSLNHTGFKIVNHWVRKLDDFLIGRFLGADILGFYSRGYSFMRMPVKLVTDPGRKVLESTLASIQDEKERVKRIFIKSNQLMAYVTMPVMVGMIIVSEEFIVTLIGPKWLPTVPMLRILALAGLILPLNSSTGWIFVSQGRTDYQFYWSIVTLLVLTIAFSIGLYWGGVGVALAYTACIYLFFPTVIFLVGQLINMTPKEYFVSLWRVTLVSLLMGVVVLFFRERMVNGLDPMELLISEVVVGLLGYVLLSFLLNKKLTIEFLDICRDFLGSIEQG